MFKYKLILVFAFISLSFSNSDALRESVVLQGIVTDDQKLPLDKVHLYTTLGEEETFSNAKGEFSFRSSQPFPIRLTVQNQGYQDKTIILTEPRSKLTIVLKRN